MKKTKDINRHIMNPNTLICSCGRSFEGHKNIELMSEKWRMNNFEGKVNVEKMFNEIDEIINSLNK